MDVQCDVLVVGGGVAGTMAAVAAARSGARTVLVEKESYFGGIGYAGKFQHICGLYLNSDRPPTETLNRGIVREFEALLKKGPHQSTVKKMGQVYVLTYSADDLQSALVALCIAEKNMTVLSGAQAIGVVRTDTTIGSVIVRGRDGEQSISSRSVIDASGGGELAALAGADVEITSPEYRQMAGFTFHIRGLKGVDDTLAFKVPYHLGQAVEKGLFAPEIRFTTFSPGNTPDEGYCKMSIDSEEWPDRDEQAKRYAAAVHAYLASVIPAFTGSTIAGTSLRVLDREGRRVVGAYMLTQEDILSARKFPDGCVKNAWPIELWERKKGTIYHYVPRGDFYEIPFRSLQASGLTNLLTAGRCISVTHEALGSTRVMGTCMALGEQAGKASAYRAKNGRYPENIKNY